MMDKQFTNLKLQVLEYTSQRIVDLCEMRKHQCEGGSVAGGVFVHLEVSISVHYMFISIKVKLNTIAANYLPFYYRALNAAILGWFVRIRLKLDLVRILY